MTGRGREVALLPAGNRVVRGLAATTLASTLALACAACGVPRGGDFQRINPPAALSQTTTTSTSTTRPPTTLRTVPPTPTVETTEAPTTSTNPVFDVSLYFVAGAGQLTSITRQLASQDIQQVLTALTEGVPEGDEYAGLRSALPSVLVPPLSVARANGVATVELPPDFFTDIPTSDQQLAIAQIVLTMTGRPGIGQVTFTSEGEPRAVVKGDDSLTALGASVTCEDYRVLAPNAACG